MMDAVKISKKALAAIRIDAMFHFKPQDVEKYFELNQVPGRYTL
jgi:hypothetical protein